MNGRFGVFAGGELLAEFGTDVDAESYRDNDILELNMPEHLRRPAYDAADLEIRDLDEEDASAGV